MTPQSKKQQRARRFVSREGDFILERAPGKKSLPSRGEARAGPTLELGAIRRARHVTQVELAERLGVEQGRISRLESRGDPKLSTVLDYLRAVGASNIDITFEDGERMKLIVEGKQPKR